MPDRDRRHLFVANTATAEPYTTPTQPGPGPAPRPARNREEHAAKVLSMLESAWAVHEGRLRNRSTVAVGEPAGTHLEFRGEPGFSLKVDSLEDRGVGIELTNFRKEGDTECATVFVPRGQVGRFLRKVEAYTTKETETGVPRNAPLIESISEVRLAVLESFWTDDRDLFPGSEVTCWWEVWLRHVDGAVGRFRSIALQAGMDVDPATIAFPEVYVLLARGTREQLSSSIDLLDVLAELRLAKSAALFLDRPRREQREDLERLLRRARMPDSNAPAACILDTGVDRAHPLLEQVLAEGDVHACDPEWGTADHHSTHGHGTGMAGLALFGDLTGVLDTDGPVVLEHRLESVKLLPPTGGNEPRLYGDLTNEAIARAEVRAPQRRRVVCAAVTASDGRDRGRPSSWSAAVDDLCAGAVDDQRRLVILSAGNVHTDHYCDYPDRIEVDQVQDPGQSWNAITVGAYTERFAIHERDLEGWQPIARPGQLSPCTTTSLSWDWNRWPIKPDIVMEGGNAAVSPDGKEVDLPDSLSLLTCSKLLGGSLLTPFGDTSAAAALVARAGAIIMARYPNLWPEAVRALLIHSAEHTPAMKDQFGDPSVSRKVAERLLRCCGYGVPDLDAAVASAANDLTLIVQESMRPFDKGSMNEMHLHELPWPRQELEALGETPVEMRVTLSYFVESSPGERGWDRKHRYASHGLRFHVRTPEDSLERFRARVNAAARDDVDDWGGSDAVRWLFGPTLTSRGSIHHDRWHGTAAQLATREHVAVVPVIGWWRERAHLGRSNREARYALVVTIRAPSVDVDLYTAVANRVGVPVQL